MTTFVKGSGNPNAAIMLVGEAPGEQEEKQGRPFIGPAGNMLDGLLARCGLMREELYITNVVKVRPPNNQMPQLKELGLSIDDFIDELYMEICTVNPKVIVPMGNVSLKALLQLEGIMKYRGSPYGRGPYGKKFPALFTKESRLQYIIPTLHPAFYLRKFEMKAVGIADFKRIQRAAAEGLELKKRKTIMKPSLVQVQEYVNRIVLDGASCLSFDVETWRGYITCLAVATSDHEAFCIPFWSVLGPYWRPENELKVWVELKKLFATPIPKIAHNALFDCEAMAWHGVEVHNMQWDTMLMHHTMFGELPHDLAFLTSIYTTQVYYKDDGKHWTPKDGDEQYWNYNGLDAMIPVEMHRKLFDELEYFKLTPHYYDEVVPLLGPLETMTLTGMKVNKTKRADLLETFEVQKEQIEHKIGNEWNKGVVVNTSSPKQVSELLYVTLSLPPIGDVSETTKTLSTGSKTLIQLATIEPDKAHEVVTLIMKARKLTRFMGFLKSKLDPTDERLRCSYKIHGTRYSRISSAKDILRVCGTNLQNWPRGGSGVRIIVVGDDGMVFIHADLGQAEARVVAHLAEEPRLLELFELGGDVHKRTASWIFGCREVDVTPKMRYLGKRAVHAGNYGMGWVKFRELIAKDAIDEGDLITVTAKDAKAVLANFHSVFKQIEVWHQRVEDHVRRNRWMEDLFGRKYYFYNRMDNSLIRSAIACVPQATVANLLDRGLVRFFNVMKGTKFLPQWPNPAERPALKLQSQIHDAILISCIDEPDVIELMKKELIKAMSIPLKTPRGETLHIPVDIKVGRTWEEVS